MYSAAYSKCMSPSASNTMYYYVLRCIWHVLGVCICIRRICSVFIGSNELGYQRIVMYLRRIHSRRLNNTLRIRFKYILIRPNTHANTVSKWSNADTHKYASNTHKYAQIHRKYGFQIRYLRIGCQIWKATKLENMGVVNTFCEIMYSPCITLVFVVYLHVLCKMYSVQCIWRGIWWGWIQGETPCLRMCVLVCIIVY